MYEFTARTVQSRFLLRPSDSTNEIIVGVIAVALAKYPDVRLHAFAALSNHMQGLVSSDDGESLSRFIGYLKSNIARKVGRKVRFREKFWGRRARLIPVLDELAQVVRLKYILSQSVQEGLVPRPELWPGVHCVLALTRGIPLRGAWFNWTQQWFAQRAAGEDERVDPRACATPMELTFSPLPCWAHLPIEEQQQRAQALVDEIVSENDVPGRSWLGVEKILSQDPHAFPESTKKSPAPVCHTSSKETWKAYKDFLKRLVSLYESVSSLFRKGAATLDEFPAYCFPPRHRFCRIGLLVLFDEEPDAAHALT